MRTFIHPQCAKLGFSAEGWIPLPPPHATFYQNWIDKGYHGEMDYLAKSYSIRTNPQHVLKNAQSAIVCTYNYHQDNKTNKHISTYAQGRDYHRFLRKKLKKLGTALNDTFSLQATFRPCVDSAPLLERYLAYQAGLGWIGKNGLLLNKTGSYYFIGVLLTTLPCPSHTSTPLKNYCGSCTACKQACPTAAIVEDSIIDARRCISYLTIELKGPIPLELRDAIGTRIFGCDICQECCPWNKKHPPSIDKVFSPRSVLQNAQLLDLFSWNEKDFLHHTEGSPVRRTGYECFKRNLAVALGNSTDININILVDTLQNAKGESTLIDEHINWAIHKLENRKRKS